MRKHLHVLFALIVLLPVAVAAQPRWEWIRTAMNTGFDDSWSIAIAPNGDVRIAGTFNDSISFADNETLLAYGNYDGFVARYTKSGNYFSSNVYGGLDVDDVTSIAVDNKGNLYVCGSFNQQIAVGGEVLEAFDLASTDMFLAKFDRFGVYQWAQVYGSKDFDESAPFVAVDSTGNVYLTGIYGRTATFGTKTLISNGKADMFLIKVTSAGETEWAQRIGGIENDKGLGVAVTPDGQSVYVVGTFEGRVEFDNKTFESYSGTTDMFAVRYNAAGTMMWSKRIGSSKQERGIAVASDKDANCVIAAAVWQGTDFDNVPVAVDGGNATDLAVARISRNGTLEYVKPFGATFEEYPYSVTTDYRGAILVAGYFDSTTVFDGNAFESQGGRDGFVARFFPDGEFEWFRTMGGPHLDEMRAVAVNANGLPYVTGVFDTEALFDDGQVIKGSRYSDVFIAEIACGPSTYVKNGVSDTICVGEERILTAQTGYPSYVWYLDGAATTNTTNKFNTKTLTRGTHTVTVRITDHYGCIANSDTLEFVVVGPDAPVISRDGMTLRATAGFATYQWYREGVAIPGATSETYTATQDGLYFVEVGDGSPCSSRSNTIVIGTTDVADETGVSIRMYPNPTDGVVTIDGEALDQQRIVVIDALGRLVLSTSVSGTSVLLDLGQLPVGPYAVHVGATVMQVIRR
jgi:hypothetical protein